jgi:hypothetical protein
MLPDGEIYGGSHWTLGSLLGWWRRRLGLPGFP